MGINLRDHVRDINDLFTLEEAEQLFIAAGFQKKKDDVTEFTAIEMTQKMLRDNQMADTKSKIDMSQQQGFEIKVKQEHKDSLNMDKITIKGVEQILKFASSSMGSVA